MDAAKILVSCCLHIRVKDFYKRNLEISFYQPIGQKILSTAMRKKNQFHHVLICKQNIYRNRAGTSVYMQVLLKWRVWHIHHLITCNSLFLPVQLCLFLYTFFLYMTTPTTTLLQLSCVVVHLGHKGGNRVYTAILLYCTFLIFCFAFLFCPALFFFIRWSITAVRCCNKWISLVRDH